MRVILIVLAFVLALLAIAILIPMNAPHSPEPVVPTIARSASPIAIKSTPTNVRKSSIAINLGTSSPTPEMFLKTLDSLHVRACPGVNCQTVDYVAKDSLLKFLGTCQNGWAQVELEYGWVNAKYVDPSVCEEQ